MSTRSRQLGNKFIKPEDIQNFIYDSDEENPSKGLCGEEDETKASKNKSVLNDGVVRDGESEDESGNLRTVRIPDIDNGRERLSKSLGKWYGSHIWSPGNKLNNSVSKQEHNQDIKLVSSCTVLCRNIISEVNVELKNVNRDFPKQRTEESIEDEISLIHTIKRRTSSGDTLEVGLPKRFKVEVDKEMTETPMTKPLKIELALECSRRNEPVRRRNIDVIAKELDQIGRNWKESQSRCLPLFRWGQPIIKNCSEKWDFHYFPHSVLEGYQKRLEGRYSASSGIGETSYDRCDSQSDIVETGGLRCESERVDEEESEALDYEQFSNIPSGSNSIGDGVKSLNSDVHESMTVTTRNRGRNRQEERVCNETRTGEKSSKEKLSRRCHRGNKDQKKQNNSDRQPTGQMERIQDHRQYQNEESQDSNKNFEEVQGNYENYSGSSQANASRSHYEENSAQGLTMMNVEDQVACPICGKRFEKNEIENHASECATAAFND